MTEAHRRRKHPELVRCQLLAVVRTLLVEQGPHAVTLDAVSARAGVTKGGLQHHFRSKQALLDALSEQLFEEFQEGYAQALALEEEGRPGRHARAYIRTAFDEGANCNRVEAQRAIGLLALTLPHCREQWSANMQAALAEDGDDPQMADRLLACRMAADGYWFSQMLDVYPMDGARKARILKALLDLCT
ncbi:MAG: TetR/AcrR family transcriptional regulator [Pseudomonadota bacterium]